MRLKTALPIILSTFALAACGSDAGPAEDGVPMSADEVASEMADAETPQPGQYQTTQELLELSIPGVDEELLSMMRGSFEQASSQTSSYCLTPEEAENGREKMLEGMTEADCDITRFDVSGNSIDAALSCPTGQGVSGDVTLSGTMDGDSADMEMTFAADMPGMGDATIRMRVISERIGDCEG